jgi:shikimate dehydrogenase
MTDRYAVIGNPIAHSKSPQIHALFARQTGQDISYEKFEASLDGFKEKVNELREKGYKGCNVTVPFKVEAFRLATELSERAKAAQAVNTLVFDNERVYGDNTDGIGLVCDIEQNIGVPLINKRVLLIGAGGAAYGVALPIQQAGSNLSVFNRNQEKADKLADHLARLGHIISVYAFPNEAQRAHFDIVINATSAGLSDEMPPLPTDIFATGALAYDMMYGRETPFMKFARQHGAAVVSDGLGMLVEQAAEAFLIWRNVRTDTAPVIAALRKQQ